MIKESIGTLSAFLAVEDEIWRSTNSPLDLPTRGYHRCLAIATKNRETHDAIERYVIAAIVDAREVYTDPKWLAWADHWIAGRDRSFASARSAHRMARQACDRESVAMAVQHRTALKSDDIGRLAPVETRPRWPHGPLGSPWSRPLWLPT